MPKKRYRPEEIISKLREADVLISQGKKVVEVIKALGVTDVIYYRWRQEYGGMSVPQAKRLKGAGEGERAAPEGGLGPDPGQDDSEGGGKGKLLSPSRRRACVKAVCEGLNVSERRVCKVLGQYRSTQRHVALGKSDEDALTTAIVQLASRYGRYGYRRVTGLLREAGWKVNKKRIERIWRREGLKVPARQPKRGRPWFNDGSCVRLRPEYPNHVWAYGFVADRTYDDKAYRMLTVIDEFSRECLAIVVGRRIDSSDVLYTLADLFIRRSIPAHIRSDNGPEFCAKAVREWLGRLGVETLFIEPGSPWENGYIESFNGKLRDELLNREIFYTLIEARILIEQWRRHYNGVRPHSTLGYRPPAPETIAFPGIGLPSPWNSMETPGGFLH